MHKLFKYTIIAIAFVSIFQTSSVKSISPNIVISQIQLGDAGSANNEFVEIYNNSDADVDISNWCLYYASASSTQIGSKMLCFEPNDASVHMFLAARSKVFIVSNYLSLNNPSLGYDYKYSETLSGTGGHVRLIDSFNSEVDKTGWGSAVNAEGSSPATKSPPGNVMIRKAVSSGILQDTDDNAFDFDLAPPEQIYNFGNIYEIRDMCGNIDGIQNLIPDGFTSNGLGDCVAEQPDLCKNLDGTQDVLPVGYELDNDGYCQVDVCLNIDGLQLSMPSGKELDHDGNCLDNDNCLNLDGIQSIVPIGYKLNEVGICLLDLPKLKLSEVFPNPTGSDENNEFIEIYNPNDIDVDLSKYVLVVNAKKYSLGTGTVKPNQYEYFSNQQIKFTLTNTSGTVKLETSDGEIIDEVPIYYDAKDDQSWSLINSSWQYTNVVTPGQENKQSINDQETESEVEITAQKPCGPNQYRNPETNRCRNIVTSTALSPCKDGQYRSEETGRCRNIVSDISNLLPCAEGQERNPDTNRCRNIKAVLGASVLKPCPEGQERNPDTNRCRKASQSTIPEVKYQPKTAGVANNNVVLWSSAGVGTAAIGYGVWEWRQEVFRFGRKILSFMGSGK